MATPCMVVTDGKACTDDSHVVLYGNPAAADYEHDFGGVMIHRYEPIGLCLKHGGDTYDAIHRRAYPSWLQRYVDAGTLPSIRIAVPAPKPGKAVRPDPRVRYGADLGTKPRRPDGPPHARQPRPYERT